MCIHKEIVFHPLPVTPPYFDEDKFKAGDETQIEIYKANKTPNQKKVLTYEQILKEESNYCRQVPMSGCFIDYDNKTDFEIMERIIIRAKLRCLILRTQRGGQFLFKLPSFYKKEMNGATNWFGIKFDTKASWINEKGKEIHVVQNMRVCGMERIGVASWDLDTPIPPDTINIDELDVLPYWLWGKGKDEKLFKDGKMGKIKDPDTGKELPAHIYKIDKSPFTNLMKMNEGERHNYIFSYCRTFALYNGFLLDDFKAIIHAIHDEFLVKLGTPMSDSDLLGDIDKGWEKYKTDLISDYHGSFDDIKRIWTFAQKTTSSTLNERQAAEYLFNKSEFDFYVTDKNADGTYNKLLHKYKDGNYEYRNNVPERKQKLREFSTQNFKKSFFVEVEEQIMQLCIENNKIITRSDTYVIVKNKILSCINLDVFDFSWLGKRPPTDVVLPWNWYPEEWVEEHKEDLGGLITQFIKELARDVTGKTNEIVEQWLWVVAGACMIPENRLEKIVILSGGGQNGKSLYTSLIKLCLGENMFNESKIFDNTSNDSFWEKDLDKGICCIVDDIPKTYNKNALTNIKGAITGTDPIYINEKFKPEKKLDVLPQIIACTNFEFELYDKSEGMKRRVLILPTEFHIDDSIKDEDLQYKLVLNTTDSKAITKYQMSNAVFTKKGKKVKNMYTGEKGVIDSLDHGSLCWFANKARYMYIKWKMKELKLEYTPKMKSLLKQAFDDSPKGQCEEFIDWYLKNTCGGTDASKFDLSLANGFYHKLYLIYKNEYCILKKLTPMEESIFNNNCGRVVRKFFTVKKKKNNKGISYPYIYFNKPAKPFKKK